MGYLKRVLALNGWTSLLTGMLLVIGNRPIAQIFGTNSSTVFVGVGCFLVLFSVLVLSQARKPLPSKRWAKLIIALDVLWVVESCVLLLLRPFAISSAGNLIIAAIACWVGLMAALQIVGLKRQAQVVVPIS